MDNTYIESVYRKCLDNTATPEERRQFVEWIKTPKNETVAKELLLAAYYENIYEVDSDHQTEDQTVNGIIEAILWADKQKQFTPTADLKSAASSLTTPSSHDSIVHRVHFLQTAWFRYAAILLLIAGTARFLYLNNRPQKEILLKKTSCQQDIAPGGNKAILTLSDGSTIVLDSAANGALASQGNTKITKLGTGKLAYEGRSGSEELYNTITTPRGGQYQVILPDGSRAWLNALSSIKFPAAFGLDGRRVEVTGEVYFEVSKNRSSPFMVSTQGTSVEVLGTSFNINAYGDEDAIRTTLLDGSVKVAGAGLETILQPGHQALIPATGLSTLAAIPVKAINTDPVVAWKNGYFKFSNTSLQTIMRQLARWYNLEVVYDGEINKYFTTTIPRNTPLSQVLRILELTKGVHFRISGNKVIVAG